MEKRLVIATVLSALVLFLWMFVMSPQQQPLQSPVKQTIAQDNKLKVNETPVLKETAPILTNKPSNSTQKSKDIIVENDKWRITSCADQPSRLVFMYYCYRVCALQ